jgi:GTPase SAR1 family protein
MVAFKALLVEGTSGVGKSKLINALIRRHVSSCQPRKVRTPVHLAQSHTYGPLAVPENNRTLTVDANLRHLERIVGTLVEAYRFWIERVVESSPGENLLHQEPQTRKAET